MNRRHKFAVVIALVAASAASAATAAPIDQRQARQDARIGAGVAQGQLSRCEARRLDARTHRIAGREHYYRSTAGLQPWERADLQRRLDSTSADIARQRHDGNGCY